MGPCRKGGPIPFRRLRIGRACRGTGRGRACGPISRPWDDRLVTVNLCLSVLGLSPPCLNLTRDETRFSQLRLSETTGRPLAAEDFVEHLERRLGRPIARRAPGRKPSPANTRHSCDTGCHKAGWRPQFTSDPAQHLTCRRIHVFAFSRSNAAVRREIFSRRPVSHADLPCAAHSRHSSSRGDNATPSMTRLIDSRRRA
jgi:hypothetical protein